MTKCKARLNMIENHPCYHSAAENIYQYNAGPDPTKDNLVGSDKSYDDNKKCLVNWTTLISQVGHGDLTRDSNNKKICSINDSNDNYQITPQGGNILIDLTSKTSNNKLRNITCDYNGTKKLLSKYIDFTAPCENESLGLIGSSLHITKKLASNLKNSIFNSDNTPKKCVPIDLWTRDVDKRCYQQTAYINTEELGDIHPCNLANYKNGPYGMDRYNPAKSGKYAGKYCTELCKDYYKIYNIPAYDEPCFPSEAEEKDWEKNNPCYNCPKESFIGTNTIDKNKQNKQNYLKYHVSPTQSNIDSDNIIQNIYIGCLSIVGIYIIYKLYKKK